MIPREKRPGECDCDWSGSCDEHAFVPPGAQRIIEARAHAAGYEAAVRDFWRGVCEERACRFDAWAAEVSDASVSTMLAHRRDAARLRAWAKEGA